MEKRNRIRWNGALARVPLNGHLEGQAVTCPRCDGTMIGERYTDLLDDTGQLRVNMWRCLTCGEVCDPVILANRARRPEIVSTRSVPKRRVGRPKKKVS